MGGQDAKPSIEDLHTIALPEPAGTCVPHSDPGRGEDEKTAADEPARCLAAAVRRAQQQPGITLTVATAAIEIMADAIR